MDWHHEACRVMTIGDREGRIFLSHPHTNYGFFFLYTTLYLFYIGKTWKRLPENPEYAEMGHGDVILTLQWRQGSTCGCSFFIFPYVWYGCVSHRGKNNGNPDLVCKKINSSMESTFLLLISAIWKWIWWIKKRRR